MTDPGAAIAAACSANGLDLSARLQAGWYNERVAPAHRLPDYGDPGSEVIVIGNSHALWPAFIGALKNDPGLMSCPDPIDRFTEQLVESSRAAAGIETQVRWAHRAEPAHISFQTLAEVAGLAWRSPASLSVHPVYGPWIALRAAVILPRPGPPARPAGIWKCRHCRLGCEAALARTLSNPSAQWRDWLAVRDACPCGRDYRYGDRQIRYHYTRSRDLLAAAVAET